MPSTVANIFGLEHRRVEGDAGIEIEVEGNGLIAIHDEGWRTDHDSSLRGGLEYVMTQPKSLEGVHEAIDYLKGRLDGAGATIDEAIRAGMHVHVNVQHLTPNQLFSYITTYTILENLLTHFCGKYRVGNHFCLRMEDAEYLPYIIERVAKEKSYHLFGDEIIRYSAMNLCSLAKYGSVVFRAMRSTPDFHLYKVWVQTLVQLRDLSMEYIPTDIVNMYYQEGAESFCKHFLGDFYNTYCKGMDVVEYTAECALRAAPLGFEVVWPDETTYLVGGLEFPTNIKFPNEPEEDF